MELGRKIRRSFKRHPIAITITVSAAVALIIIILIKPEDLTFITALSLLFAVLPITLAIFFNNDKEATIVKDFRALHKTMTQEMTRMIEKRGGTFMSSHTHLLLVIFPRQACIKIIKICLQNL